MSETIEPKVIRSRSNKSIGDIIEDKWRVTAVKIVAPPYAGNPRAGDPPRQGIYDYTVEPTFEKRVADKARDMVFNRTVNSLKNMSDAIIQGKLDNVSPEAVLFAAGRVFDQEQRDLRTINRAERAMVTFRRMQSR